MQGTVPGDFSLRFFKCFLSLPCHFAVLQNNTCSAAEQHLQCCRTTLAGLQNNTCRAAEQHLQCCRTTLAVLRNNTCSAKHIAEVVRGGGDYVKPESCLFLTG